MPTTIPTVTSSTRPGSPSAGDAYFETDTKNYIIYDGVYWRAYASDYVSGWSGSNTFSGSFDGSNDYVDCGSISSMSGVSAQTLSVWFKPTVAGDIPNIGWWTSSTKSYGWSSSGSIKIFNAKNGINESFDIASYVPNDTDWHNYVAVFSSGAVTIYIDGSSVLTGTASNTTLATSPTTFRIGQFGTVSLYEAGLYDEISLWDVALDLNDVSSLYNSGTPIDLSSAAGGYDKQADLTHWWRIGDHASDTGSGGSPANGDTISNVENAANSGTNDGTGNGPIYSTTVPA
jgi:hypothetical protein